ncbi:MAG: GNAT family N-acetyltransferase [Pseudoxanthomonas sp.]
MSERFVYTSTQDPLAKPLFDGLEREYSTRYADVHARIGGTARQELERYPPSAFALPDGAFLLLLRHGQAIGGGAFMRHADADTAEFKRIWTRDDLRRQGIAERIMEELESRALQQGYRRIYLTTGFRQPEAKGLYLKHGYTPLFDLDADPEVVLHLAFEKHLSPPANALGAPRAAQQRSRA